MTWLVFSGIAVAGGFGAALRMLLDGSVKSGRTGDLPWGAIRTNAPGTPVVGFLTGLTAGHLLPETWHLIIGTGFLGGYTTFSTASVETVRLAQERRWAASLANALGTLALATGAAGLGLWLG